MAWGALRVNFFLRRHFIHSPAGLHETCKKLCYLNKCIYMVQCVCRTIIRNYFHAIQSRECRSACMSVCSALGLDPTHTHTQCATSTSSSHSCMNNTRNLQG